MKENANKLHFNHIYLHESFPMVIANKIFQFTVLLFIYLFL